jgi:hypothetical protein
MKTNAFGVFAVIILTITWSVVAGFLFGATRLDRLIIPRTPANDLAEKENYET